MQTHKLNEKAIAVTGLPEGVRSAVIAPNVTNDGCVTLIVENKHGVKTWIKLPPGNWKALGFAQSLSDADRAVYEPLLKSEGLYVSNPFKNPNATKVLGASPSGSDYEVLDELKEQWQSAQLLTNPLILITS